MLKTVRSQSQDDSAAGGRRKTCRYRCCFGGCGKSVGFVERCAATCCAAVGRNAHTCPRTAMDSLYAWVCSALTSPTLRRPDSIVWGLIFFRNALVFRLGLKGLHIIWRTLSLFNNPSSGQNYLWIATSLQWPGLIILSISPPSTVKKSVDGRGVQSGPRRTRQWFWAGCLQQKKHKFLCDKKIYFGWWKSFLPKQIRTYSWELRFGPCFAQNGMYEKECF